MAACDSCLSVQVMVAQKVAVGVYKGVTTSELDELAAETSASMTATHPDYALVNFLVTWCSALPLMAVTVKAT